jgi:hypothetical protein
MDHVQILTRGRVRDRVLVRVYVTSWCHVSVALDIGSRRRAGACHTGEVRVMMHTHISRQHTLDRHSVKEKKGKKALDANADDALQRRHTGNAVSDVCMCVCVTYARTACVLDSCTRRQPQQLHWRQSRRR